MTATARVSKAVRTTEMKDGDSGLMRRGILLLALMTALAGVVLFIVLHRPARETPSEQARPEWLAVLGATPQASFPASLAWSGLPQLATALPSPPGWQIRYNAVSTLALRGSPYLPLDIMREMLDEERQLHNWRVVLADGRQVANEGDAYQTVVVALKSLTRWHRHFDAVHAVEQSNPTALNQVYQAVDRLTKSANLVVRTEAEKTRQELRKG
jgi:hypothetical protein